MRENPAAVSSMPVWTLSRWLALDAVGLSFGARPSGPLLRRSGFPYTASTDLHTNGASARSERPPSPHRHRQVPDTPRQPSRHHRDMEIVPLTSATWDALAEL